MKVLSTMWKEDEGVLTFEWILLITLLTIGIVSGLAAARDALIDELSDVAEAMLSLDQSFSIDFPLAVSVHTPTTTSGASDSSFLDNFLFRHCDRVIVPGQPGVTNCDFGGGTAP